MFLCYYKNKIHLKKFKYRFGTWYLTGASWVQTQHFGPANWVMPGITECMEKSHAVIYNFDKFVWEIRFCNHLQSWAFFFCLFWIFGEQFSLVLKVIAFYLLFIVAGRSLFWKWKSFFFSCSFFELNFFLFPSNLMEYTYLRI